MLKKRLIGIIQKESLICPKCPKCRADMVPFSKPREDDEEVPNKEISIVIMGLFSLVLLFVGILAVLPIIDGSSTFISFYTLASDSTLVKNMYVSMARLVLFSLAILFVGILAVFITIFVCIKNLMAKKRINIFED